MLIKMPSLIANTHPHLKSRFLYCLDKDGNKDESITWNMLSTSSNRYAMWKCPNINCEKRCEHIYKTTVNHVTNKRNSRECPFCSIPAHKICPCNSLQGQYPQVVAKYWDYRANGEIKPCQVAPKSGKYLWFKCPDAKCDHHKWRARTADLIFNDQGCPFCSGNKFCECYCLASEHCEMIEYEWDYEKNKTLDFWSLGPSSSKYAWWICKKCKYEWNTRIYKRTLNKTGCPKCKQSHMEKIVFQLLTNMREKQLIKNFEAQWPLKSETRLIADFLIILLDETRMLLEMDGVQHFLPKSFGSKSRAKEEMFRDVQESDMRKKEWCANNHVRLLRLSYLVQEADYEAELLDFIASQNVHFRLVGQPFKR